VRERVHRRLSAARGMSPCLVCGEPRDYLPHEDPDECNAWMLAHEGRPCASPSQHHAYQPQTTSRKPGFEQPR
jgi:hypothetical protein